MGSFSKGVVVWRLGVVVPGDFVLDFKRDLLSSSAIRFIRAHGDRVAEMRVSILAEIDLPDGSERLCIYV